MSPRVSVCIGTYNRVQYLDECLDSVFAQTLADFEVIVVDDASTDGTVDLLARYTHDARLRVITRASNSGLPAVARNQACRAARGDYLAFLDSDDYWSPEKLEKQVAFMEQHPECGLCHTFARVVESDGRLSYVRREGDMPRGGDLFRALLRKNFITTSSVLMRHDLFMQLNGFAEGSAYKVGEDRHFYLRVIRLAPFGFVDQPLTFYRKHDNNICASGSISEHDRVVIAAFKHHYLDERDLISERAERLYARRVYGDLCRDAAYWARMRKQYKAARELAAKGWLMAPLDFTLAKEYVLGLMRRKPVRTG